MNKPSQEDKTTLTSIIYENIFSAIIQGKSHAEIYTHLLESLASTLNSSLNIFASLSGNGIEDFFILNSEKINALNEVETEIKNNLPFILQLIDLNKGIINLNQYNQVFTHIFSLTNNSNILLSPCFFDKKLKAFLVIANQHSLSRFNLELVEQLSFIAGFTITLIKTNEFNRELQNKLKQAEKLETIGKLASGMAHDFNNLLSSIFASVNLLKRKNVDAESIKLIDTIEDCAKRSRDLTKGLLSYGKKTVRQNEEVSTSLLIDEISNAFKNTLPQGIKFNTNVEKNTSRFFGNSTQIHQVLMNLCVNAKEAIKEEGNITLSAKNFLVTDDNQIQFPSLVKGNYISITVTDNGCGISEENIQKIFDPYFSTKKKETDSGIGLYVSYGIIKAHNGHIEVESELNKGTSFCVFLPAIEQAVKHEEKETKIILLADDEEMLQDLIAELLESADYYVLKVQNGKEVLKLLTEEIVIDLLVIDYNMPEMNGIECIKKIRELNFNFPIILSTGSLGVVESLDIEKIGINKLLNKPYDFETLLETVRALI